MPTPRLSHSHDLRVLFVVGDEDELGDMASALGRLRAQFAESGLAHQLSSIAIPGEGHLIEPPFTPQTTIAPWVNRDRSDPYKLAFTGTLQLYGGSPGHLQCRRGRRGGREGCCREARRGPSGGLAADASLPGCPPQACPRQALTLLFLISFPASSTHLLSCLWWLCAQAMAPQKRRQ